MKAVAWLLNSFLYAMVLSVLAFKNVWLEMRVNIGWLMAGLWLIIFVAGWLILQKKHWRIGLQMTVISFAVAFAGCCLMLGFQRLGVVPAAIIREGIGLTRLPFRTINLVLISLLALALLLLVIHEVRQYRKS